MLADMAAQRALTGPRRLASVFLGGGTPSLMDPAAVAAVIDRAKTLWAPTGGLGGEIEVTLEANPTDAEAGRFAALADAGVNRLSMGVQALDDASLRMLGRNHTAAEAMRAVGVARAAFARLSVDLIYARPGQTEMDWADELNRALDLGFEHVSPYQLTIEGGTAFGRAAARGTLVTPGEEASAGLYETTQAVLETAGFDAYEVSNHARGAAARSAHNLHVWRGGDYVGVGPGAHGRLTLDGARTATAAHRGIADYVAGVDDGTPWAERTTLSPAEADEERVLLGLRTVEGVSGQVLERLGLDDRVEGLVQDGFLARRGGRVVATARARPVLDGVTRALLA
ncbi:radical SAM family heme chaperone HemW [Brevundimonas sp.]|uniref:radical SAM family heme chaperone HemW n=1 Tax=Brevundimonas sp. TaxID=1871086 RepID=UPI002FD92F0E